MPPIVTVFRYEPLPAWHWWRAEAALPYGANPAGSTLRNSRAVLTYDDTTEQAALFPGVAHKNLTDANRTFYVEWASAVSTSGGAVFSVQFEATAGKSLDVSSFAAEVLMPAVPCNASLGFTSVSSVELTKAQMDNLAARGTYRVVVSRKPSAPGDDMVGLAHVLSCYWGQ